jgi:hypothetical protein
MPRKKSQALVPYNPTFAKSELVLAWIRVHAKRGLLAIAGVLVDVIVFLTILPLRVLRYLLPKLTTARGMAVFLGSILMLHGALDVYWVKQVWNAPENVVARELVATYQEAADIKATIVNVQEPALKASVESDYAAVQAKKAALDGELVKLVHDKAGVTETRPLAVPKADAFTTPENP